MRHSGHIRQRSPGSYELRYNGFTVDATTSSGSTTTVMDGPLSGRMQEIQPGVVVGSINESNVSSTVTMLGTTTTNTVAFQGQSETGSPVDYDCELGRLTFTFTTPRTGQQFSFSFIR